MMIKMTMRIPFLNDVNDNVHNNIIDNEDDDDDDDDSDNVDMYNNTRSLL